jgi:hypothetical protein
VETATTDELFKEMGYICIYVHCRRMGGTGEHFKQSKPGTEIQRWHIFSHMQKTDSKDKLYLSIYLSIIYLPTYLPIYNMFVIVTFFAVLGFELRAYTLSHSTSPFLC